MTKAIEHFYLLGSEPRGRFRFRLPVTRVRKRSEIHEAIRQARKRSCTWIATRAELTDDLLRQILETGRWRMGPRLGRLLLVFPPRLDSLAALQEFFSPVAWGSASLRLLPYEELAEALAADNRRDLFIGGFIDPKTETLILYRGDLDRLPVPLSIFKALGSGPKPNLARLSFTDYGQTVRLGDYQAASDAILYEADPEYRRRLNVRRRASEKSFGASLRRLRILKGLRQNDFSSIPARTIARIERGEVRKPHRETIERMASDLGVDAEEIETF